jgi:hypothetical protein
MRKEDVVVLLGFLVPYAAFVFTGSHAVLVAMLVLLFAIHRI